MFYQQFLSALVQLSSQRGAVLCLEEREIFLKIIEGSSCEVKTLIHAFPENIPYGFTDRLGVSKKLTWHAGAACLEIDPALGHLVLVGSIDMRQGAYLSFKDHIRFFLEQARDWQDAVHSLV